MIVAGKCNNVLLWNCPYLKVPYIFLKNPCLYACIFKPGQFIVVIMCIYLMAHLVIVKGRRIYTIIYLPITVNIL